jgi:hypothetical protein
MSPKRIQSGIFGSAFHRAIGSGRCFSAVRQVTVALLAFGLQVVPTAKAQLLQFIQPTNGAVFSTRDEIPVVLRASAPNDVILSADVFANVHQKIATAIYCCPICLCVRPEPGQETTLQIPASYENGAPLPIRLWQGWTNVPAGEYQLTAKGVGENGTAVAASPVAITVLDLTLHIYPGDDDAMVLSIAQGAMVRGSYDLEVSQDLRTWTRLGMFSPGAVAAFYWDKPPKDVPVRFYRAVFIPSTR